MSWQQSHWLGADTHDEYIRKWRDQQDALAEFFYDLPIDRMDAYAPAPPALPERKAA